MFNGKGYDLSDIAAVTRGSDDGFFGGNSAWWIILLFMFAGWGGGGFFGGGHDATREGELTRAELYNGLGQQDMFTNQNAIKAELSAFERDATNRWGSIQYELMQGLNGTNNLIAESRFAQQNCCCENRAALADVKYAIATENCADRTALSEGLQNLIMNNQQQYNSLVTAINNGFQAVYNQNCMDKIDAKNEKIADLERQLSESRTLSAINGLGNRVEDSNTRQTVALEQYLNPTAIPAYIVQNPNCCGSVATCGCGSF